MFKLFLSLVVLSLTTTAWAGGAPTPPPKVNATQLNSSKSNIYRQSKVTPTPKPARATTIKGSKSNSSDKTSSTPTPAPKK